MSEVRIGGQRPRELREGLPDAARGGNQWRGLFCAPRREISARTGPNRLPIPCPRLSLGHDRPFPVPEHLFGAAGELFRPRGPYPGRRPPADQAEPGAGRPSRPRSRRAGEPGRAPKSSPESASPTAPTRSRWPMPATSSAISCPSSATAAPSCSARSSTRTASAATSSSRDRARRRSRAAATAAPRSGRCCANTSSARRCLHWASPPPARWPR